MHSQDSSPQGDLDVPAIDPVPAPWQLTGDAWIFVLSMPHDIRCEGSFTPAELSGREAGGVSAAMVVNYTSSNVGPYKEILWAPGAFDFGDCRRTSITRIFVSSWESVKNGQRNWGIPKDRADFIITQEPDGTERVIVSQQGHTFADLRVKKLGFSFPVTSALVPAKLRELGQVHQGQAYFYTPSVRGWLSRARLLEAKIDKTYFPDLGRGRVLAGFRLTRFNMHFPVARTRPV
jgi:hypothetical protein